MSSSHASSRTLLKNFKKLLPKAVSQLGNKTELIYCFTCTASSRNASLKTVRLCVSDILKGTPCNHVKAANLTLSLMSRNP